MDRSLRRPRIGAIPGPASTSVRVSVAFRMAAPVAGPRGVRGIATLVRAIRERQGDAMPLRACVLATALAALGLLSSVPAAAVAAERGSLLSAKPIARLSATQAAKTLRSAGLPTRRARRGISAYRLSYVTVGVDDAPTTASALLVLPRGTRRLPTVVYEHGTLVRRADAPSQGLDSFASSAAVSQGIRLRKRPGQP